MLGIMIRCTWLKQSCVQRSRGCLCERRGRCQGLLGFIWPLCSQRLQHREPGPSLPWSRGQGEVMQGGGHFKMHMESPGCWEGPDGLCSPQPPGAVEAHLQVGFSLLTCQSPSIFWRPPGDGSPLKSLLSVPKPIPKANEKQQVQHTKPSTGAARSLPCLQSSLQPPEWVGDIQIFLQKDSKPTGWGPLPMQS